MRSSPSAAPSIDREVTAPGAVGERMPFTFSVYDCEGLTPD